MAMSAGSSIALKSFETSFQQDLNGDGTIGAAAPTIESYGSTSLAQIGDNYALYATGTTSGPVLKINDTNVYVGQWGAWSPIGVEQTATGYEVAWKNGNVDEFIIWGTDFDGDW